MKNWFILLFGIVLHIYSCRSNHDYTDTKVNLQLNSSKVESELFNLMPGETIVVTSSAFGCTHHEHFRATIKHINSQYQVCFQSLQDSVRALCEAGFLVNSIKNYVWDKKQYESFIKSIRTDTSKHTTSFLSYEIRKGTKNFTFKNSTGDASVLSSYLKKYNYL